MKFSEETRAKISAGMKAAWQNPELRAHWVECIRTWSRDPKWRKKHSKRIQKTWTKERRRLHGEISRRVQADPAFRARQAAAQAEGWSTPQVRDARVQQLIETGVPKAPLLTNDEVREVRALLKQGCGIKDIGNIYGVSAGVIYALKSGRTYRFVT